MKLIIDKDGLCEICLQDKKTVGFEDVEGGYYGHYVSFEICKECFMAKLEEEE